MYDDNDGGDEDDHDDKDDDDDDKIDPTKKYVSWNKKFYDNRLINK